jgi:hypothetical protein
MSPQESSMVGDTGEASDSASDSDTGGQEDSGALTHLAAGGGETSRGRI